MPKGDYKTHLVECIRFPKYNTILFSKNMFSRGGQNLVCVLLPFNICYSMLACVYIYIYIHIYIYIYIHTIVSGKDERGHTVGVHEVKPQITASIRNQILNEREETAKGTSGVVGLRLT